MTWLKKYNTLTDWDTAKSGLEYPSAGLIKEDRSVVYMTQPIHTLPIKAVFYDSATGNFVKMYSDEITEVIPSYQPIGVEVVPAEHDVYGTGQAGIMSLVFMNCSNPEAGSTSVKNMRWGGSSIDTSLPNLNKVNLVDGTTADSGYLSSDQFTGTTSLDGVSKYWTSGNFAPSPYNADGSRNEAYYTTAYSTANALSDFDGVGNTAVLTGLATADIDWKTASTITNSSDAGYYPAACCCWRYHTSGTSQGQWYLPAAGELGYVVNRISAINEAINKINSVYFPFISVVSGFPNLWSSSEGSGASAHSFGDYVSGMGKGSTLCVRAFIRL